MARVCPLFSSSSGNSFYIGTAKGDMLIDAGVSYKRLNEALLRVGSSPQKILAVAVTHEHIDHIKGLKLFLKNSGAALIASSSTLKALTNQDIILPQTKIIEATENMTVGDFEISRFATSHDCAGSSGYTVTLPDGSRVALCTDLGIVTDEVREALLGCKLIMLESNHDVQMLEKGPYPQALKLRILSQMGHLSNNACARELPYFLKGGATRFLLGHLSQHNNLPMLASSAAKASLSDHGAWENKDYILYTARPDGNEVTVL